MKREKMKRFTILAICFCAGLSALAQPCYQRLNDEKMEWFEDVKFGLFIHWGLYSVAGGFWSEDGTFESRFDGNPDNDKEFSGYTEWLLKKANMPMEEYSKIAGIFDWSNFNAQDYIDLCFASGQRYIVITAKHHDGFAMYHSKYSDYNIVDKTPTGQKTGRDPLKELADACQATKTNGSPWEIKMCFYYSQDDDWHYEYENGKSAESFQKFQDSKVKIQVKELLTEYGDIGLIWYDLPNTINAEQASTLRKFTLSIDPDVIINSRIGHGQGDYTTTGDNGILPTRVNFLWEACGTINHTWGYRIGDEEWKSEAFLLQRLVQSVSRNGNYLLNIGPKPDGSIPEGSVKALKTMGDWIKPREAAVIDAEPSPYVNEYLFSHEWGYCTTEGNKLYLLVDQWPDNNIISVPLITSTVKRIKYLVDENGKELTFTRGEDAAGNRLVLIDVPDQPPHPIITVIELEVEGQQIRLHPYKNHYDPATRTITLDMKNFQFFGPSLKMNYSPTEGVIKSWRTSKWAEFEFDSAVWHLDVPESGAYRLELDYAITEDRAGVEIAFKSDRKVLGTFTTTSTGSLRDFKKRVVGIAQLKAGKQVFVITPLRNEVDTYAMHLRGVRLIKVD